VTRKIIEIEASIWPATGPKEFWGKLPKNELKRREILLVAKMPKMEARWMGAAYYPPTTASNEKLVYVKKVLAFSRKKEIFWFADWVFAGNETTGEME